MLQSSVLLSLVALVAAQSSTDSTASSLTHQSSHSAVTALHTSTHSKLETSHASVITVSGGLDITSLPSSIATALPSIGTGLGGIARNTTFVVATATRPAVIPGAITTSGQGIPASSTSGSASASSSATAGSGAAPVSGLGQATVGMSLMGLLAAVFL